MTEIIQSDRIPLKFILKYMKTWEKLLNPT